MAELLVVRHGQASFGAENAANYDQLSDLGHKQAAFAGACLRDAGWVPDRLITGTLQRQKQTLASMGFAGDPETHAGFNEYDFHNLLSTRFDGNIPDAVRADRKTHFRTLRETILEWQAGGLENAGESWVDFVTRIEAARAFAVQAPAEKVLVISSGGTIGQLTAACLGAPATQMLALNLQVKNTSMTRFIFSNDRFFLHEFNATPHLTSTKRSEYMSYS